MQVGLRSFCRWWVPLDYESVHGFLEDLRDYLGYPGNSRDIGHPPLSSTYFGRRIALHCDRLLKGTRWLHFAWLENIVR